MRILIVEDDDKIADFLERILISEGHQCKRIASGIDAVNTVLGGDFDIILLDIMLPGVSGLDICQQLRFRNDHTPIIMLTALDATEDVVHGLRIGADDYLTKPFDIDELLARIDTVVRRKSPADSTDPTLTIADVTLNTTSKVVTVSQETIQLTAKELSILELLMSNPEKLFSRERILNNVWGETVDPMTNVVDVYIGRLRKKLGKDQTPFIETVRGMGYRISQNAGQSSQLT